MSENNPGTCFTDPARRISDDEFRAILVAPKVTVTETNEAIQLRFEATRARNEEARLLSAHAATEKELEDEQEAHGETKWDLASEREAHEETKSLLAAEYDVRLKSDAAWKRAKEDADSERAQAERLAARVKGLEEALFFYGNREIYEETSMVHGRIPACGPPIVIEDCGERARAALARPAAGATSTARRETYDAAEDQKDREACPIHRCGYSPCGGCKCEGACLTCHPEPAAGATTEHDGEEGERG